MHVTISQINGISFIGKGDTNHWVAIDGPEKFGGSEAGSRPKELLLIALGGCTGSDVASILKKKRATVDSIEINIDADVAKDYPKVFTKIHIEYVFYGKDPNVDDLKRAIELSQDKYCPISAMLKKACPIDYSFKTQKNPHRE